MRGTASKFNHSFYKIAGKSGTSNKVINGKYSDLTYASFVGCFPADAPKYSCMVVIDSPQGEEYHFGGQVAAPVVKDIADKLSGKDLVSTDYIVLNQETATSLPIVKAGCKKDLNYLCSELRIPCLDTVELASWGRLMKQLDGLAWRESKVFSNQQMPHVLGMMLRDALFLLENRGLEVIVTGNQGGQVKTQSLLPGTKIVTRQTIVRELN